MDINQNLEQINTFEKGMNTDVSDTLLPNNQYRYAENLRFTSHDTDNTGELQPIKDMSLIYDIGEPIIATSQIRDIAVFITGTRSSWKILALNKKFNNLGILWMDIPFSTKTVVFGPCGDLLGEHVSIVTRYENDNDIKVYIADGVHQLMSINIMHNDGRNEFAPKDIKYLTNYSDILLSQAQTEEIETTGGLKPAVIQYTYLLYKEGGAVTKYAPFTRPIYLLKDSGEGYLSTEPTDKAIRITINTGDVPLNGLDHIQVYRITYSQYGQDPEIYLIYEDEFHGALEYVDSGVNIVSYGKNEFLKQETYDKIKPAVIESKGNYLFAGNIEDFQDEIDAQWPDKLPVLIRIITGEDDGINGYYRLSYDGKVIEGTYHASLMPGETYEYGIVLYDELGRRSSVRYIGEVYVPEDTHTLEISPIETKDIYVGKYTVYPVGVKIIFTEPIQNCSGYEIVRCLRGIGQKRTLYQGIVGLPIGHETELSTPAFLTRNMLYPCADYVKSNQNVALFACPECVYLPTETLSVMSSVNTFIKGVCDYTVPVENISENAYDHAIVSGDYFLNSDSEMSITTDVRNDKYITIRKQDDATGYWATYSSCLHTAIGTSIGDDEEKRSIFRILIPAQPGDSRKYYYSRNTVLNVEGDTIIEAPFFIDIDLTGPVLHDNHDGDPDSAPKYLCPYSYCDNFSGRQIMTYSCYIDPMYRRNITQYESKISTAKIVDSSKPGDNVYNNGLLADIDLYKYIIGTYTYCNFLKETRPINWVGGFEYGEETWCTIYAGGKALLLNLAQPLLTNKDTKSIVIDGIKKIGTDDRALFYVDRDHLEDLCEISVANIKNESYTGYGATENFEFCSFGNYYTYTGRDQNIYDGDTYINVFRYNHTHAILQSDRYLVGASIIYMVPIQSSIDLLKASGDLLPDIEQDKNYFFQDYMGNMFKLYQLEKDAYIYNAAYSQEMNLMTYHPVVRTQVHSGKFDTRIKVSEEKLNGEKFDSWLNFDVVNTLDADTRFGEITHMRLFKDALMFWLKEATGIVSVNERVIVQDVNDTDLLLGTGGVLQRYDYLSTKYGMQVPYIAETQSDTTLYFWDAYKKEILAYSDGQLVQPMVEAKTIKNYINNHKNIERPCFVYDSDHKEVLMRAVETMPIVYNEFVNQFTSVYDYTFTNSVYFNDGIWLTNERFVYEPNAGNYIESYLYYVVNKSSTYVKVFDNVRMGVNLVSNDYLIQTPVELPREQDINYLLFRFKSPQQYSETLVNITDREYDYRFAVPRALIYDGHLWNNPGYGQRMRGKYLISHLIIPEHPNTAKNAFSLQYITTKFRISYS